MIVQRGVAAQWLREAQEGETLVYARVTFLPVVSAVAHMMREAAATGYVTLYRQRREHGPGDENFFYIARRTCATKIDFTKPLSAQAVTPSPRSAIISEIAPQVRSMLAEGVQPNASAIARQLGIYSVWPVQRVLRQIERMAA